MVYGELIWELEAFAGHKQLVGFVLHRLVEALQELKGQVAESMASAISEFVGKAGGRPGWGCGFSAANHGKTLKINVHNLDSFLGLSPQNLAIDGRSFWKMAYHKLYPASWNIRPINTYGPFNIHFFPMVLGRTGVRKWLVLRGREDSAFVLIYLRITCAHALYYIYTQYVEPLGIKNPP